MSAVERRKKASPRGPLGSGSQYLWQASAEEADMAMPPPISVSVPRQPRHVTIDLRRTAIIMIDTQNDFWADATIWNVNKCFGFVIGSDAVVASFAGLAAR